jgi:hypothetical protein
MAILLQVFSLLNRVRAPSQEDGNGRGWYGIELRDQVTSWSWDGAEVMAGFYRVLGRSGRVFSGEWCHGVVSE